MANEKKEKDSLSKPDVKDGLKAIADWYFLIHSDNLDAIECDEILIADDGEVFYANIKGTNAAFNYCTANKFKEAKKFKR